MARIEFNKDEYFIEPLNKVFRSKGFENWSRIRAVAFIQYQLLKKGQEVSQRNEIEYSQLFYLGKHTETIDAKTLKTKDYLHQPFLSLGEKEYKDMRLAFGRDFSCTNLTGRNDFLRSQSNTPKMKVPKLSTFYFLCLFLRLETGDDRFFLEESRTAWRKKCQELARENKLNRPLLSRAKTLKGEVKELFKERVYNVIFIDETTTDAKSVVFEISNFTYKNGFLTLEFASLNDSEVKPGIFEVVAKVHGAYYLIERDPVWGYAIMIRRVENEPTEFSLHYLGNQQIQLMPLCGVGIAIKSDKKIQPVREHKDFSKLVYLDSQDLIDQTMIDKLTEVSWKLRHLGNPIVEYREGDSMSIYQWAGSFTVDDEPFSVDAFISTQDRSKRIIVEAILVSEKRKLKLVTETGFYDRERGFLSGQLFEVKNGQERVSFGLLMQITLDRHLEGARINLITDFFKDSDRTNQTNETSFTFEIE